MREVSDDFRVREMRTVDELPAKVDDPLTLRCDVEPICDLGLEMGDSLAPVDNDIDTQSITPPASHPAVNHTNHTPSSPAISNTRITESSTVRSSLCLPLLLPPTPEPQTHACCRPRCYMEFSASNVILRPLGLQVPGHHTAGKTLDAAPLSTLSLQDNSSRCWPVKSRTLFPSRGNQEKHDHDET
jgi:hypothetical protein